MRHDYLGLSIDRLFVGLLVGFFCLIFHSSSAFASTYFHDQWESLPGGGQVYVRRSSTNGEVLQLLDSSPGAGGVPTPTWTFANDGAGGVIPSVPAPTLNLWEPIATSKALVPISGISEKAAVVDAADLAGSAAPEILSLAGKAVPLVGTALTLWDFYKALEDAAGSSYSSAPASHPSDPSSPGLVPGCSVTTPFSSNPYAAYYRWVIYPSYPHDLDYSAYASNGALDSAIQSQITCNTSSEANSQYSSIQSQATPPLSLSDWTAAQTASTIANDIAKFLGSNPSNASTLVNDLARMPNGTLLSTPQPITYSGPSSASGAPQTITTTNPDGSTNTQTVTPSVHVSYGPNVTISNATKIINYYCGQGANPSTASTGSAPAPVSSTNSTGTCAVTSATQSSLLLPDAAVAPTESFPSAPTVSVVGIPLSFSPTTSTGQCPPDVSFSLFGSSYNISWKPICGFASDIEPFVTASGAILAGVLIFR